MENRPCICAAKTEAILRSRAVFFQKFDDIQDLAAANFQLPHTKGKVIIAIIEVDE